MLYSQKRSEIKLGSIKVAMVETLFAGRWHFDGERDNGLFLCRARIVAFMNGNCEQKLLELVLIGFVLLNQVSDFLSAVVRTA